MNHQKIVFIASFLIMNAIFEAWLNKKMGVVVIAPSMLARIINRVVILATGAIIYNLVTL